ncbi:MAG: TldD/PmbA family protein [Desulfitobacteriaceae bacterium]|nr:TldD/PmbA family protein [Desulfitobacteriaceae bacterium]MDD4752328.1 TldD/PmbA family protein [Desulfitobacteriaceae bacterium]
MANNEKIGKKVIQRAMRWGASSAEAFFTKNKELSIDVSDQQVETMKLAEQQGLGIRVLRNQKLGFAYTSDLTDSALEQAVQQAVANSDHTEKDQYHSLPGPASSYAQLSLYDPNISRTPVEKKIELAKEIERIARNFDPRVRITERCSYVDSVYEVSVVNSLGVQGSYEGAYCGAYSLLVAEENGDSQTGFEFQYKLNFNEIDPHFVGTEGAKKAVRMLGAKNIRTQEMMVVFDPYVATNFLGLLTPSIAADSVQKGKSRLVGKVGEKIISTLITLVDDGTKPEGLMSSPFDGEGVPSQRTVLFDHGVLQGYLYNSYSAEKDGRKSTGNGMRSSYMGTPEIGITNCYIENGTISQDEIIAEINKGVYITEVMGMHTANPISGDFSLGASGILIESGELVGPVRGIAIAGNVFDLFSNIDRVGSNLTFFVGKGSPTLRVSRMTVSGSQ